MRTEFKPVAFLLAFPLLFLGGGATADEDGGFYAKAFGGLSALQTDEFTLSGTTGSVSLDPGFTVGAAFGYDYGDRPFRAEIEYAYRTGDASDFSGGVGTGGDFASTTVMLNGYYMFRQSSAWTPYVGLGVGYVTEIDFDIEGGSGAGEYNDRGLIAFQGILGVEYDLSERFSLYGEGRYFTAGSADLSGPGTTELSADYDTLELNAGLTFKF